MAILLDLSTELLLEIIAYLSTTSTSISTLWPLSSSCKRLNTCCSRWIFKKYYLCIRASSFSRRLKYLTPLDNLKTLDSWDLSAVTARLHHLREKASYVKELIIEDRKVGHDDDPDVLPECILPDLLDALQGLNQVTSITIDCGYGGTLPLPLWEWITTKDLTKFSIGTLLAPPPNAMIHPSVRKFIGGLYKESMAFLELIHPEMITLRYDRLYGEQPPITCYKPSCSHNPQLRSIVLDVWLPEIFERPLFDFSGVPAAKIDASFSLGVEYKFHIPAAWKELKSRLPIAFAEDINSYDVRRSGGARVTRPPLAEIEAGWKPKNAAHLEGEAAERAESERMDAYYRSKARQYFR